MRTIPWIALLIGCSAVAWAETVGSATETISFDLVYPNYRQMVFPDCNEVKVTCTVPSGTEAVTAEGSEAVLSLRVGDREISTKMSLRNGDTRIVLSTSGLPDVTITLAAVVRREAGGEELARKEWTIRKLSPLEASELAVFIDRHNNLIVDGHPFFPLGWYGAPNEAQMAEVAASPFNCMLWYGTNRQTKAAMLGLLDAMHAKGLKLIYCMNDVYPTATYLDGKGWEGVTGNAAITDAVVPTYRDHPAVLGWYLNDELPPKLVPDLLRYYEQVRSLDPNHPCLIVLCREDEVAYFPETTDIMGGDSYPIPGAPWRICALIDRMQAAVRGHKPVWFVPQAFGWYQYHPAGSDRGRIPTEEELNNGRAPTYDEERCMTYLALAHGAKGLIYYCYYDLRVLPQYEEMWGWLKEIAAEVRTLAPVLLSPDDRGAVHFSPDRLRLHTKLKAHGSRMYLIAVNASHDDCRAEIRPGGRLPDEVQVMFENRTVPASGGIFSDEFKPMEAHVYSWEKIPGE